ncbi:MAG: GTPase ObgE, partial [Lachnospiraceae bacterium]|nr:GTPase ObgE [Lachnospiraceae bacterium]
TLGDFRHQRKYLASDGEQGGKRRMHGADGEDLVIKVPEGTIIRDEASGKVIADMSGDNLRQVVLTGGKGGVGNMHFATSTMQIPKYAKPGGPAKELWVTLELKVIADVGLVGFPNVGKSTLISAVSNARPKVANYHFTTLNPVLGVVDFGTGEGFVMADIPGLIEGASEGVGLGHEFLRHVDRCKLLLHVVDAAGTEGRDPVEDIRAINEELVKYDEKLAEKPQIIVCNKCNAIYTEEGEENPVDRIRREFETEDCPVFAISAVTGEGTKELVSYIRQKLSELPREMKIYEPEFEYEVDSTANLPYTVEVNENGEYVVEGPRIEKMLGYTNLDSEKGFQFFQKFLKDAGILKKLEDLGIQDGDTVRMYGHGFDYYK